MKKIAKFIVEKKYILFWIMFILSITSVIAMFRVKVNGDMTKYLPDSSQMKIGLDIMTEEFPDAGINATFRVMFDNLTPNQITEIQASLKEIPGIDTVNYSSSSSDYNKDNHTLFIMQSHHKYGTAEEKAIEKALKNNFNQYEMVWANDNTGMIDIPIWIFIVAVAVLMIILFSASNSWFEPLLFLFVIGCAILLNMGTNVFLNSVSDITYSISAILQLVISMDYSIILSNCYRQAKAENQNKFEAMKTAVHNAFTSVASSAMTTVIGLLMLCFMRFKIGMDIGIVLAKGVFMSMLCVLLMLPGLLLFFDKAIEKSSKKSIDVPLKWLAKFSYKARYVLLPVFLVIAVGSFYFQQKTHISYIFTSADKISDIFPPNNTMVFVYENQDEENVEKLTDKILNDKNVKNINGYYASMTKAYPAEKLAAYMSSMSEENALSAGLVNMIYYIYNGGKEINSIAVSDMMHFISETVLKDPMISGYMDPSMLENAGILKQFSNAESLQKEMSVKELSTLFNVSESDLQSLLALYYADKKDYDAGKMTLNNFATFIIDDLSKDPTLSAMFDKSTKAQIESLVNLTDAKKVTENISYKEAAKLLDQKEEMGKMLFVCYYALTGKNGSSTMTFPQFVNLLQTKILPNPDFASYIDPEMQKEIGRLEIFADKTEVQKKRTADEMSGILGFEEKEAKMVYTLKGEKQLSIEEMINYILSNSMIKKRLDSDNLSQLQLLQKIIDVTVNETTLAPQDMAQLLGMDELFAKILYTYNLISTSSKWTVSLQTLINYIADNGKKIESMIGKENLAQMKTAKDVINSAVENKVYSPSGLAALVGMKTSQARQLYLLNQVRHGDTSNWSISIEGFINFVVNTVLKDKTYASQIDSDALKMIVPAQTIVNAVIQGKNYTAEQMTEMMAGFTDQIDTGIMKILYLYYASAKNANPEWALSTEQFLSYLNNNVLKDPRFASLFDDSAKQMLSSSKEQLDYGKSLLKSEKYGRLIIDTSYPDESPQTFEFISQIDDFCKENFNGNFYFIGNSAMGYEMQQTFHKDLLFITILTIVAIFLIVALAFKSISIPFILVMLVQCGVNITIISTGVLYGGIIYLALLIVECILMGATIDYGILFCNYYVENRKTLSVPEAIEKSYELSKHTIFTSGLILVLVTAIVGNFFGDPTISGIISTISLGGLSAILLILFVLPGLLAACDKLIVWTKNTIIKS